MRRPRRGQRKSIHVELNDEMVRTAKADALDFVAAYLDRGEVDLGYVPDPRAWALMGALAELASDAATTRWPELTEAARAAVLRASANDIRRTAKNTV